MIKSTPPSQRNSSIELYRIVATFTVLIVHFNGWFVGGMPENLDLANPSAFRIGQAIIESATCICINMFLLISGYFGIRLKLSSVIRICLLLLFIYVPFYLVESCLKGAFSVGTLIRSLFIMTKSGYFVQCYLMLMFLSPVLNAFIEKMGKRILPWVIVFVFIEFWFDNIKELECLGFGSGYSIMHFVLIYMIARCLFLFNVDLVRVKIYWWVIGYLLFTIVICIQYVVGLKWTYDYSNPVCIMSSICSFMPFVYYNYHNRAINWIASSTFAVYVIQVADPAYSYLVRIDNHLLVSQTYGLYLLYVMGVISLFFTLCVLYDKVCGIFIGPITRKIHIKYDERFNYR